MKTKIIFQAFALLMCFAGCTRQTQKAHIIEKQDSIIIERALMPSDNIIIFNPDQSMEQNQTICALIDLYNGYEYLRVLWSEFELWYVKDMAVEHEAATTYSLFFDEKLRAYVNIIWAWWLVFPETDIFYQNKDMTQWTKNSDYIVLWMLIVLLCKSLILIMNRNSIQKTQ